MKVWWCLMLAGLIAGISWGEPVCAPAPANQAEFLHDMQRYVEQLGSANVLVALDTVEYLSSLGPVAVPALIAGLKAPNPNIRGWSAVVLGRLHDPRAITPLIELLDDTGDIQINVLSDDGHSYHAAYGSPLKGWVRRNAQYALQALTGQHCGNVVGQKLEVVRQVQQRWRQWWQRHQANWDPRKVAPLFLDSRPQAAACYPIPPYARYLRGVKICLDPGHGGQAARIGFKRGATGLREAEINLRVARFLRDFLTRVGAVVLMTRDSDRDLSLAQRAKIAVRHGADLFLSIHHNWSPRYTSQATTVWYHGEVDYSPASLDLGRYIFQGVTSVLPMAELDSSGGLKSDYLMYSQGFGVLRNLGGQVPGVLVELSFFSNYAQEIKLRSLDFLKKEAYGLFCGLCRYCYAGIPDWKVRQPRQNHLDTPRPCFQLQLSDGLQARKMWGWQHVKILTQYLQVKLDGHPIAFEYERSNGILKVRPSQDLQPGKHTLQVRLLNIHKISNWPRVYVFYIQDGSSKATNPQK